MTSDPDTQAAFAPALPSVPVMPVPDGSCDTHVHVFDPARYPYAGSRSYTPPSATAAQLAGVAARLGVERVVVVQPSCYGHDNAAVLDAVRQLGLTHARGVVALDEASLHDRTSDIEAFHRAGVRGVRLNGSVNDLGDGDAIAAHMARLQTATAHLGWHVQMYMPVSTVKAIAPAIAAFKMPVVLDHFGGLDASSCVQGSPDVDTLLHLLRTGNLYLKLSAPYRVAGSKAGVGQALADVVRRFAQAAPDRLLWGSDWPHTGGAGRRAGAVTYRDTGLGNGARACAAFEPFRSENAAMALDELQTWLPDPAVRHRILVSNPARLYGFDLATAALPPREV